MLGVLPWVALTGSGTVDAACIQPLHREEEQAPKQLISVPRLGFVWAPKSADSPPPHGARSPGSGWGPSEIGEQASDPWPGAPAPGSPNWGRQQKDGEQRGSWKDPRVPYQVAIPEAAAQIQPELAQLPPGYQKGAEVYKCTSCSIVECQLPLDCPVEEVWKKEGNRTALKCRVQFQTPPDVRISWKFVRDVSLRTRDLSLFRDLHLGAGSSLILRPTRLSHHGTYACQLTHEDDVLARKYFYLNVTSSSQGAETDLQDMFQAILQSPAGQGAGGVGHHIPQLSELLADPNSLQKRSVVLLMVGLALSAMLSTLLLGGLCCWARGRP
ncbi:sperm acrosome membrane-associated protein 6 [Carettochelys insculpta]|uniref:sperm acrosome membrane-associated protein 6 n=1 Tax=Carettochelys insculpta TaxID=44489 RepID=UPI003EBD92A3